MNKNYMVSLIAVIVLFLIAYVGTQQGAGLQPDEDAQGRQVAGEQLVDRRHGGGHVGRGEVAKRWRVHASSLGGPWPDTMGA